LRVYLRNPSNERRDGVLRARSAQNRARTGGLGSDFLNWGSCPQGMYQNQHVPHLREFARMARARRPGAAGRCPLTPTRPFQGHKLCHSQRLCARARDRARLGHAWVTLGSRLGHALGHAFGSRFWVTRWVTLGKRLGHAWVTPGSRLGHAWVTLGSRLGRAWVAPGSRLGHAWVTPWSRVG
jgi:hypothetical protein